MAHEELVSYIKNAQGEGHAKTDIQEALLKAGWSTQDIDEAFVSATSSARDSSIVPPPPVPAVLFDGVGVTLSKTFAMYKERFAVFIGIMMIPFGFNLISLVRTYYFGQSSYEIDQAYFVNLGIAVLSLAITSVAQLAVYYSIHNRVGINASFRMAFASLLSYWWLIILIVVTVLLGFILLIVPGIIFSIWFVFAVLVLVVEGKRGGNALTASREYVRGYWWLIFGKLVVGGLVFVGIAIPFFIAIFAAKFVTGSTMLFSVLVTAFQFAFFPLTAAYLYHTYINVRDIKASGVPAGVKGKHTALIVMGILFAVFVPIMILASVVLASLNTARGKGMDAGIKATINSTRAQAELYYDNNPNSYEGLCTKDATTLSNREYIKRYGSTVVCNDSLAAWAVSASLVSQKGFYYCVDSTGFSSISQIQLAQGVTACSKNLNGNPY